MDKPQSEQIEDFRNSYAEMFGLDLLMQEQKKLKLIFLV